MASYDELAAAFHRRIECIAGAVDSLAPGVETLAMTIVAGVMNDRKILICSSGADAPLATYLQQLLRSPDEGPSLPALAMTDTGDSAANEALWRDLRTLSRDGDVLLSLDTRDDAGFSRLCDHFALERNLSHVALCAYTEALDGRCVNLQAEDAALRRELLLMVLHCLQDQLRHQLLGE